MNYRTTVDALPHFVDEKNIKLFERQGVFFELEMRSRLEILIEEYCKLKNIEAMTMLDMAKREILPAVSKYIKHLSETTLELTKLNIKAPFTATIVKLVSSYESASTAIEKLDKAVTKAHSLGNGIEAAKMYRDKVIPTMATLRGICDDMELNVASKYWPLPSYGDILFSVRD